MKPTRKTTAEQAYHYAKDVIKGRCPEVEPIIQQDAAYAYRYARDVIKGRWPEAESIIQQNLAYAYRYARSVIKGRWPEAEPIIQQDVAHAYHYAREVIKGRWPEAEESIANTKHRATYASEFFNEPVVAKDQVDEIEWKLAGAIGYFAPSRLFERKTSMLNAILEESPQEVNQ